MSVELREAGIRSALMQKMAFILEESDFDWLNKGPKYRIAAEGGADVKVAAANVGLETDIWEGLKNPATTGLFPLGLQEIWEYYSFISTPSIDNTGRNSIFPTAKSFDWAKQKYKRAVLVSVMFPLAEEIFCEFASVIEEKRRGSLDYYSRWWELSNKLLERAVGRLALELQSNDRGVVVLVENTIKKMSTQALPVTRQDKAHGPCKQGNFPHKSFAALLGLGQFGLNRLIIRDELVDGKVERFMGPIRSMIIFDTQDLDPQANDLNPAWRERVFHLNDFQKVDDETKAHRFCTYSLGENGCRQCLDACPSGALASSSPMPSGQYPERLLSMKHRFYDGRLQFNFDMCIQERKKLTDLYSEWACSRCIAICASKGKRNPAASDYTLK